MLFFFLNFCSCLADRIVATIFHTVVSCYIPVKHCLLIKRTCTIWPCVLIIMTITSLLPGLLPLVESFAPTLRSPQMMLLGPPINYTPDKSHVICEPQTFRPLAHCHIFYQDHESYWEEDCSQISHVNLTIIIPGARLGYEVVNSQRGE